jgi:hypothetical protein
MSAASDEYEQFIASIIADIKGTGRDIEILCFGRNCKLEGETGQKHQIDVAFIDRSFPLPTLVLVECKLKSDRNAGPDVPKIADFNEKDIGVLQQYADDTISIIVTSCGWSKGAKLISDRRELRREVVPFKADAYSFRYENIIMGYATSRFSVSDSTETEVIRDNKSLGKFS